MIETEKVKGGIAKKIIGFFLPWMGRILVLQFLQQNTEVSENTPEEKGQKWTVKCTCMDEYKNIKCIRV